MSMRINSLGKKILAVREEARLSQGQLVECLKNKGIYVKKYTISRWENNVTQPTIEAFLALCDICGVSDIGRAFSEFKRLLRFYDLPVSAGLGSYLHSNDYEMIEVDDTVPDSADYAVKVRGDSMTPQFEDGQIIFIHEQLELNEGEIGIFRLDNEMFLKKLGKGCLISLNPTYAPIPTVEYDDFKVIGKVVGKFEDKENT